MGHKGNFMNDCHLPASLERPRLRRGVGFVAGSASPEAVAESTMAAIGSGRGSRAVPEGAAPGDALSLGRLLRAVVESQFVLFAQPIVELTTGTVAKHELLIRMIGSNGGLLAPADFLPTAEHYGLIAEIDRWVLRQAAGFAAQGHAVHVNISGGTLADPDIGACVERELLAAGAHPSLVAFEITETAAIDNEALAAAFVNRLRSLGCRVALDDFGTGYGGFSSIKRFPVDFLKIDREFVTDVLTDLASEQVVCAIVQLAAGFGIETVAEAVEDRPTLDRLRALGVDYAQGYHFARPAPAVEVLSGTAVLSSVPA